MILGLRTHQVNTPDLAAAKAFYSAALGKEPYFDEPYYVGYNVGGFELGLIPDGKPVPEGTIAYWGVASVEAAVEHMIACGATLHDAPKDVGGGITVAAVVDPFGNLFGLIDNPHFDPAQVK